MNKITKTVVDLRGELPPVGTECEVSNCNQPFAWCEIKYMGSALCVVDHKSHSDQHYHLSGVRFRPIPTERDKLVEMAADDMRGTSVNLAGSHLRVLSKELIDAGWRPIKQQTEDEFVKQAIEQDDNWGYGASLL